MFCKKRGTLGASLAAGSSTGSSPAVRRRDGLPVRAGGDELLKVNVGLSARRMETELRSDLRILRVLWAHLHTQEHSGSKSEPTVLQKLLATQGGPKKN